MSVGDLKSRVFVGETATVSVPRADDQQQVIALLPPTINRGDLAVETAPGVWAVIAPRDGLYRVTIVRAQVTGMSGGGAPLDGDFVATAAWGSAFARLAMIGYPFFATGGATYCYTLGSAAAIMELAAGDPLTFQYTPGGPDHTDAAIDHVDVFGIVAVELVSL